MNSSIKSIEEIFDWCLKTLDIKNEETSNKNSIRKSIQRYKKNKSQKIEESNLVFNDFIEDILEIIEVENNQKEYMRNVLDNFIEFYKCFTLYVESYHTTQKQLDFLVAKDILIPFFALYSSLIFGKHLIILKQIKPDLNKKSFLKFLEWAGKNICEQDIKKYISNKFKNDSSKNVSDSSIDKSIDSWLDLERQIVPRKVKFKKIVQYLNDCKKATHLNLYHLALFSKLLHAIQKKLEGTFTATEIELLIEHYYCLLDFHIIVRSSWDIQDTEFRIYNELLRHIDPRIINRNHYFDDYFVWTEKLIEREYITPHKTIKQFLNRFNDIYYRLSEEECMKYIEINLPVMYFNNCKSQKEYFELTQQFGANIDNLEIDRAKDESQALLVKLFFVYLNIEKEKNINDKLKCNEIFKKLENDFWKDNKNPYICFLKTRYYIFDNNLEKALEYCRKCVELGVGKLGEHFKEAVMTGLLLSAKDDNKKEYNFFRNIGLRNDALFYGRLKVPAYGRGGTCFDVPNNKESFVELQNEYDKYFANTFKSKLL